MSKIEAGLVLKERYKIVSLLGQGGMGEVFLAEDLSLDTQVAVKINHNLNETASNQFIREARLLASLKHPNLPRVIDYFTENDSQVLVMDYIPGDDLRKIVERKTKPDQGQIMKWALQLADALSYLHNRKPPIFHRDIKPANIKLTPSGDVILVDFGIAKTGDPSQETQTGAWAFSPGFAPPEQVSGMRTGPYSDQYSLASTIYYLFAGKPPVDSAQRMMGSAEFVPLEMAAPNIPDHVNAAITRALSVKPADRFESIADFIAAFSNAEPASAGEAQKTVVSTRKPVPVPPMVPPVQGSTGKPRKKGSAGIFVGIFLLLAILVGGYFGLNALGYLDKFPIPLAATSTATATVMVVPITVLPPAVTETATLEPTATPEPTTEGTPETIGRGGRVAFVSNRQADGYNQVWLMDIGMDAVGKITAYNLQKLTDTEGDKSQPTWSPDGTKLLFVGESKAYAQNGTPYAKDIYMIDFSQENPVPVDITQRAGDDVDPSWSATGQKIAYTSYYREDGLPQIFTMNADGSEVTRISERFAEHFPVWTPNDDFLVYVMDYSGMSVLSMRDRWSLYTSTKKFDMSSDAGRLGNVSDPQLTVDGSMIVYTRMIGTKTNLFTAIYKDRGRTVTQLTDSGADYAACWSPDGLWILFTSERDGDAEVYIIATDGSNLTNLTGQPSVDKDPAWQPIQN
jgi:eukaryotic-like serine/threonine-protein kinase